MYRMQVYNDLFKTDKSASLTFAHRVKIKVRESEIALPTDSIYLILLLTSYGVSIFSLETC